MFSKFPSYTVFLISEFYAYMRMYVQPFYPFIIHSMRIVKNKVNISQFININYNTIYLFGSNIYTIYM